MQRNVLNAMINVLVTGSLEQANAVKEKFCRFGETQESCGHNYGYRVFPWKLRAPHNTRQNDNLWKADFQHFHK